MPAGHPEGVTNPRQASWIRVGDRYLADGRMPLVDGQEVCSEAQSGNPYVQLAAHWAAPLVAVTGVAAVPGIGSVARLMPGRPIAAEAW
jgi:hypothetical protein